MAGALTDAMVISRFGAVWLVWFRRLRDEGLEKIKPELKELVLWDEAELRHEKEMKAIAERTQQALQAIKGHGSERGD